MLQFCSRWSFNFTQAKKYLIVKSNYLIEAPPARPSSAYNSYWKEKTTGTKYEGGIAKIASEVSSAWNALSNEHKSVYGKNYKELTEVYDKEKAVYA